MAPSGSRASSSCGDDLSAEEDSEGSLWREVLYPREAVYPEASLSSGEVLSTEEDSSAFSICGQGASAEEEDLEDCDSTACSAENSKAKRARLAVSEEGSNSDPKLDVVIWSTLDDHLIEKIIARLPFKTLFQASTLSKTWRLMLHSHSFQSEVHNSLSTSSWKSYAPLFVNSKTDLVGYESGSKRWHRLPAHSYLSEEMIKNWSLVAVAGSLFCWTCLADPDSLYKKVFHVHVTNPLTESWKRLPPRPNMDFPEFVHVGLEGNKVYKVILGTLTALENQRRVLIHLQVFDSRDNSWNMESYINTETNCGEAWGGSAFINGILYVLVFTWERKSGYTLISFDVKEKVWKEIPYLCQVFDEDQKPDQRLRYWDVRFSQVFVCGSKVMLVVIHLDNVPNPDFDPEHDSSDNEELYDIVVSVFRLDLERGLAFELSRAPKEMVSPGLAMGIGNAAAQGDCIYIGGGHISCSSILYNVNSQEWHWVNSATDSSLPFSRTSNMSRWQWTPVTYQPGLNPFLEV